MMQLRALGVLRVTGCRAWSLIGCCILDLKSFLLSAVGGEAQGVVEALFPMGL